MKNYLAGLLFILVTVSCTAKKENEQEEKTKLITSGPIGVNSKGEYEIVVADTISQKWKTQLKESFGLSGGISLSEFEIIKTTTQGDATKDSYVLLTYTSDKSATIATILDLKKDGLYFHTKLRGKSNVSQVIMCNGVDGNENCVPVIVLQDHQKRLICPAGSDCEKTVAEIAL